MRRPPELESLVRMSGRIGADTTLVQGPGGNTSIKLGDQLWVKASGRWLADAERENIFIPLSLSAVRERLADGLMDDFAPCIAPDADEGLRPSIETAFHAILPHRAVLHTHSYNCTTISVLEDGERRFRSAIGSEARAVWTPYRRPGGPLAAEILAGLAEDEDADVILLENHGVIIGADTPEEAERRLRDLEARLALPIARGPSPDPERARSHETADYGFDIDDSDVAMDPYMVEILSRAALFPDQAVFTGGAVCVATPDEGLDAAAAAAFEASGVTPALILMPGVGAFRFRRRSRGADSVIDGLVAIARRAPRGVGVRGLSSANVAELLGWDAEHYRQNLDKARG